MTTFRDPLDWYIEVCVVCGCQLGPGVGSRTNTGRCVVPEHGKYGGTVVRVVARPAEQQDGQFSTSAQRLLRNHPEFCTAESRAREPEAVTPLKERDQSVA